MFLNVEISQLKIELKNETRFLKDGKQTLHIYYCVCNISFISIISPKVVACGNGICTSACLINCTAYTSFSLKSSKTGYEGKIMFGYQDKFTTRKVRSVLDQTGFWLITSLFQCLLRHGNTQGRLDSGVQLHIYQLQQF